MNINTQLLTAIETAASKIEDCFCKHYESRDDRLRAIQWMLFDFNMTSWAIPLKPEKQHS